MRSNDRLIDEIPDTIQGLALYVKYAKDEVKNCERKIKRLFKNIEECESRLERKAE